MDQIPLGGLKTNPQKYFQRVLKKFAPLPLFGFWCMAFVLECRESPLQLQYNSAAWWSCKNRYIYSSGTSPRSTAWGVFTTRFELSEYFWAPIKLSAEHQDLSEIRLSLATRVSPRSCKVSEKRELTILTLLQRNAEGG